MDPQAFQNQNNQPANTSSSGKLGKKNIITILVIAILFLSIPFAVKMVQQRQELRSKASGGDVINFTGPGVECKGNECTTTDSTINIELRAPVPTGSQ